jgi:hypothetical protein
MHFFARILRGIRAAGGRWLGCRWRLRLGADWGLGASFLDYALFGGNSTQLGLAIILDRLGGLVLAEMVLHA